MWQEIKSLAKKGTTIFLTTQYLEEADQLADKIAILAGGKIVAEGTSAELKKILPQGQIELRFSDQKQLNIAEKLLSGYEPIRDESTLSLTLKTDGSATQVAQLFTKIQAAHIEVAEFSQKTPTLDDAFLKIINENKEKK